MRMMCNLAHPPLEVVIVPYSKKQWDDWQAKGFRQSIHISGMTPPKKEIILKKFLVFFQKMSI